MKDRRRRIYFAAGCLVSVLVYRHYGAHGYRILAGVSVFFWIGLYALSHVWETEDQRLLGRYGSAFVGGFLVTAILTPFALVLWKAMGGQI